MIETSKRDQMLVAEAQRSALSAAERIAECLESMADQASASAAAARRSATRAERLRWYIELAEWAKRHDGVGAADVGLLIRAMAATLYDGGSLAERTEPT